MPIIQNCVLHSDISTIKHSQDCALNEQLEFKQVEAEVNKFLKTSHTINFSPLVEFIDGGNAGFETLLKTTEENEQIPNSDEKLFSQKKTPYTLRYKPYRSSQDESNSSLECKRQQVLDLFRSGLTTIAIKKQCGIDIKLIREWCKLSQWSGWNYNSKR